MTTKDTITYCLTKILKEMDTGKMFNGLFGKIAPGMCRLSMNGGIAIKTENGYKTYNVKQQRLTNVTNFCFNVGEEFFFVIPTNKVKMGDIILVDGKPKCVIESEKNRITVIDYESSEIKQIVPERHIFMGNVFFYGKIVSLFGNNFKGKGFNNIMKMMMVSSMFKGGGKTEGTMGFGGDMGQMMAMSMLMGGNGGNMLESMFDGISFDDGDESDDEEMMFDCDCGDACKCGKHKKEEE